MFETPAHRGPLAPAVRLALLSLLAASTAAQGPDRRMATVQPPRLGALAQFAYAHPTTALGNAVVHVWSQHTGSSLSLPIPGFQTLGLVRIDPNGILGTSIATLDATGTNTVAIQVPNDNALRSFAFDLQAFDVDANNAVLAWAANDVEAVVGCAGCDVELVETFADASRLDRLASGGDWNGGGRFAVLGESGELGSFDPTLGTQVAPDTFVIQTDNFAVPASRTRDGLARVVTDGVFRFTDFVVPQGVTVRFVGPVAARIHVRGQVRIDGTIDASGQQQVAFNCRNPQPTQPLNPVPGQPGTLGGPGGGRGGAGGDRCFGQGPAPAFDGKDGQDVQLAAVHAYAARALVTGGRGQPLHPSHGLNASLTTPVNTYVAGGVFNANVATGGGGGGFDQPGAPGTAFPVVPNVNQFWPAVPAVGGLRFDLFPLPLPTSPSTSLRHFAVGGSGGGGGGSHPFLGLSVNVTQFNADRWKAGGGGTGGGGSVVLRAGDSIAVAATGLLAVRGGDGAVYDGENPNTPLRDAVNVAAGTHWGIPCPGGGGSGGSLLLQSGRDLVLAGNLDARGGRGSRTGNILPNVGTTSLAVDVRGGDGSAGFLRLEALGATTTTGMTSTPLLDPTRHQGPLTDRDGRAGFRSTWRGFVFTGAPQWVRYVLEVDRDGDGTIDAIYSDDPNVPGSFGPATGPASGLDLVFQGAQVDDAGETQAGTVGPWHPAVRSQSGLPGIDLDAATGFRFDLVVDRALAPDLVVRKLTVVVRS